MVDSGYQGRSQSEDRGHGGQTQDEAEFSLPRTEKALAPHLPGQCSVTTTWPGVGWEVEGC